LSFHLSLPHLLRRLRILHLRPVRLCGWGPLNLWLGLPAVDVGGRRIRAIVRSGRRSTRRLRYVGRRSILLPAVDVSRRGILLLAVDVGGRRIRAIVRSGRRSTRWLHCICRRSIPLPAVEVGRRGILLLAVDVGGRRIRPIVRSGRRSTRRLRYVGRRSILLPAVDVGWRSILLLAVDVRRRRIRPGDWSRPAAVLPPSRGRGRLIRPDVRCGRWRRVRPLLCVRRLKGRHAGSGVHLTRTLRSSADDRLDSLDLAHVHDAYWSGPGRRILAHLLDAGRWKRTTGILIQYGLLPVKGHRRRRRSGSCHDWPAQYTGGRTWGAGCLCCPRAENADPLRCNLRSYGEAG
jgi:hypothetical protein